MNREAINEYQRNYDALPFEETMAAIRKKMLKSFLEKHQPQTLVEVGCGNESVIDFYRDYKHATVVEPAEAFYNRLVARHAENDAHENTFVNDFFSADLFNRYDFDEPDAIIISGMLHEIPDPELVLSAANKICNENTIVHVNVPNANSLHRLLAYKAGMIKDLKEKSAQQTLLKQPHTFDMADLKAMASNSGFEVIEEGSYFIKPFTHVQMEVLRTHEIFGEKIIDGLEKLISYLPDYGAEIFVNLKKVRRP